MREVNMDRNAAKSFEDLVVWRKAHQFVLSIYRHIDLLQPFQKMKLMDLQYKCVEPLCQFQQILLKDLRNEVNLIKPDL